jgi:hypothetical protein
VCKAELVDESINRSLLRDRTRSYVSVPGVFGVAVYLVLDFFGCTAVSFTAADYTTVTLADAGAETTKDFAVLVSPAPDTENS